MTKKGTDMKKQISKKIQLFNRIFICPLCCSDCKGEVTMGLKYRATKSKPKNKLVCGGFIK